MSAEVVICWYGTCTEAAHPVHDPCCSSKFHNKPLCCEHYCRFHFVEVNKCSPAIHEAAS